MRRLSIGNRDSNNLLNVIVVVLLVLFLVTAAARVILSRMIENMENTPVSRSAPVVEDGWDISVEELDEMLSKNSYRLNEEIRGTTIALTGVVDSINSGGTKITLTKEVPHTEGYMAITVDLSNVDNKELTKELLLSINVGDTVRVIGTFYGYSESYKDFHCREIGLPID